MATDIDAQGKVWHREIDVIIKHLKSEVKKIESKQMVVLNKQQEETNQIMDEIEQTILDLKKALDSNDINFVYAYRSRNNEFREMPPDHSLSLPRFIPENIDTKQLQEQFGSLSMMPDLTYENEFAMKTKVSDDDSIYENDSTVKTTDAENSLLDEPKMIVARNTGRYTRKSRVIHHDVVKRNTEFRNLPPEVNVSLPRFHSQKIDTKKLQEQFGSLSSMSDSMYENESAMGNLVSDVNAEYENEFTINTTGKEASMPKEPKIIVARNAGQGVLNSLVWLNDNEIWTSGQDSTIKLYNLQGELLSSIQTKSGNWPWDIAITRSGDLLYTDPKDRTVNKVRSNQIQVVTRLESWWTPRSICGTHTGDILVLEVSYDEKQTQVVRYTDSSKKQTIRVNRNGKPLYSFGYYNKFICENKNLDICVSDYGAGAIVVVNQTGKLRFIYTGSPGTTEGLFLPSGIATDSQSQILTAESNSQCIHIIDQDGQFLRDIKHNDLHFPRVLCMNNSGNIFVAEWEAQVFDVGVQETETSRRLNLENGANYKLFVTKDSIDLGDFNRQEIKIKWPLKYIRRYGFHTRNLFMLEAGRRCETGEGCFNFFIDRNQKELKMAIDNAAYDQSEGAFSVKFRTLRN
uniref:Docking protein 3 n=1 Tax=Magallana gigas TaxID=29159 RepID=K1QEK2_MAGGI